MKDTVFKSWTDRKWLNPPQHGGHAFIHTSIDGIRDNSSYASVNGNIEIADCNRVVCIEFYFSTEVDQNENGCDNFDTSMYKLDVLQQSIERFRRKIKQAHKAAKQSRKTAEEAEKAKEKKQ